MVLFMGHLLLAIWVRGSFGATKGSYPGRDTGGSGAPGGLPRSAPSHFSPDRQPARRAPGGFAALRDRVGLDHDPSELAAHAVEVHACGASVERPDRFAQPLRIDARVEGSQDSRLLRRFEPLTGRYELLVELLPRSQPRFPLLDAGFGLGSVETRHLAVEI